MASSRNLKGLEEPGPSSQNNRRTRRQKDPTRILCDVQKKGGSVEVCLYHIHYNTDAAYLPVLKISLLHGLQSHHQQFKAILVRWL